MKKKQQQQWSSKKNHSLLFFKAIVSFFSQESIDFPETVISHIIEFTKDPCVHTIEIEDYDEGKNVIKHNYKKKKRLLLEIFL